MQDDEPRTTVQASVTSTADEIHPVFNAVQPFLDTVHTAGEGGVLRPEDAEAFLDLARSGLDKPQPPLDPFDTQVHPVHSVRQACILHFKDAEAFLDLVHVVNELGQRSLDRFERFEEKLIGNCGRLFG
jgi:hypothetical protein